MRRVMNKEMENNKFKEIRDNLKRAILWGSLTMMIGMVYTEPATAGVIYKEEIAVALEQHNTRNSVFVFEDTKINQDTYLTKVDKYININDKELTQNNQSMYFLAMESVIV